MDVCLPGPKTVAVVKNHYGSCRCREVANGRGSTVECALYVYLKK